MASAAAPPLLLVCKMLQQIWASLGPWASTLMPQQRWGYAAEEVLAHPEVVEQRKGADEVVVAHRVLGGHPVAEAGRVALEARGRVVHRGEVVVVLDEAVVVGLGVRSLDSKPEGLSIR